MCWTDPILRNMLSLVLMISPPDIRLKDKKVILIAVGAAPMDDSWSIRSYEKIPQHIRDGIKYFKSII